MFSNSRNQIFWTIPYFWPRDEFRVLLRVVFCFLPFLPSLHSLRITYCVNFYISALDIHLESRVYSPTPTYILFILSIWKNTLKNSSLVWCIVFPWLVKPFNYHILLFLNCTLNHTNSNNKNTRKKKTFVIGCSCQTAYVNWSQPNGSHFGSFAHSVSCSQPNTHHWNR